MGAGEIDPRMSEFDGLTLVVKGVSDYFFAYIVSSSEKDGNANKIRQLFGNLAWARVF